MKVRILIPVNVDGRQYAAMAEPDLEAKVAQALVRGGYAQAVKERAVPVHAEVETRVID